MGTQLLQRLMGAHSILIGVTVFMVLAGINLFGPLRPCCSARSRQDYRRALWPVGEGTR